MLRVLKFFKMNNDSPVGEFIEEITAGKSVQFFLKFFSIIGRTAMLAHLMACFMAASGAGFLKTYSPWGESDDADSFSTMRRYLAGFYWAITTMSTVGYGDARPPAPTHKTQLLSLIHI